MVNNARKLRKILLVAIHILIFSALCVFIVNSTRIDSNLQSLGVRHLDQGWTISYEGMQMEDQTLPVSLHLAPGTPYSIERVLTADDLLFPTLRLRSSMMSFSVTLDDVVLYELDLDSQNTWFVDPYPSAWYFLHIPTTDSLGKVLKITFSSQTKEFSGRINALSVGTGEALMLDVIREHIVDILIAAILFFLGLVLLSTLFWLKKLGADIRFLFLGLVAILVSLWILSEGGLLQLFIPNRFMVGSISYIINLAVPTLVLLYIREIVLKGYRKILNAMMVGCVSLILLELALQVTGVFTYIAMTKVTVLMIGLIVITLILLLRHENKTKGSIEVKRFTSFFFLLSLFVMAMALMFLFGMYDNLDDVVAIGALVSYAFMVIRSLSYLNNLLESKKQTDIYKKLAFQDHLTGGWNRSAFDRDLDDLLKRKVPFRFALMDMNGLKQINDTYGHDEGDYAIISSYKSLASATGKRGKGYRMSGDEFAILTEELDQIEFGLIIADMESKLAEYSTGKPYTLSMAVGSGIARFENYSQFKEFYREVDQRMYDHKKAMKQR